VLCFGLCLSAGPACRLLKLPWGQVFAEQLPIFPMQGAHSKSQIISKLFLLSAFFCQQAAAAPATACHCHLCAADLSDEDQESSKGSMTRRPSFQLALASSSAAHAAHAVGADPRPAPAAPLDVRPGAPSAPPAPPAPLNVPPTEVISLVSGGSPCSACWLCGQQPWLHTAAPATLYMPPHTPVGTPLGAHVCRPAAGCAGPPWPPWTPWPTR
jgi:hypothetical protein